MTTLPDLFLAAARAMLPGLDVRADGPDMAVSGTPDLPAVDAALLRLGFVRATIFPTPGRPALYTYDKATADYALEVRS